MNRRAAFGIAVCALMLVGIFTASSADAQVRFRINNDASTEKVSTGANTWVDIAGTYASYNITIACLSCSGSPPANLARVEIVDTGAEEILVLKNAKITATAAVSHLPFQFWRQFDSTPGGQQMNYETRGGGQLKRGALNAAQGGKLVLRGSIEQAGLTPNPTAVGNLSLTPPSGISCNTTDVKCVPSTYIGDSYFYWNQFSVSTSPALSISANSRILKGEFWLTLTAANDYLQLNNTTTSGLQVKWVPPGGPGDEECDRCSDDECETCLVGGWRCCQIGFWCRWFGFFCPDCAKVGEGLRWPGKFLPAKTLPAQQR